MWLSLIRRCVRPSDGCGTALLLAERTDHVCVLGRWHSYSSSPTQKQQHGDDVITEQRQRQFDMKHKRISGLCAIQETRERDFFLQQLNHETIHPPSTTST